ncbi:hypothetical protein C477_03090 [Haloterrigena salina JCM 13891]|uniref:Uncharacterized protein n=1 Tax=Haloterrigena salina JCM 13891 TaxID=1227488 RepID=M0CIG3_9EURY|nr:hypothetical protein [Haloterrigena salina]ELZ23065.1 hypothetical protein C477_03090 [Haloterrigena salina JCM 13891]
MLPVSARAVPVRSWFAALFAATIVGHRVAIWLVDRLPFVTSLYRLRG